MVGTYRPLFQISKQDKIHNEIDRYDKTVPVFFILLNILPLLFLMYGQNAMGVSLKLLFVKYLPATITQVL